MYETIDRFLIFFYRSSEIPIVGYGIGTAVLAFICVLFGQATRTVLLRWNRDSFSKEDRRLVSMHNLSLFALAAKDKTAYKALNREANDIFGKVFFAHLAVGISSLWPIPFALGWMQTRFAAVAFELPFHLPLVGESVGFVFTFIPVYILMVLFAAEIKARIRSFAPEIADNDGAPTEKMLSFGDVFR